VISSVVSAGEQESYSAVWRRESLKLCEGLITHELSAREVFLLLD